MMPFTPNRPLRAPLAASLGLSCLALAAPAAEAALSSYDGSATLTYTINSIVNTTNPGDLSGLNITGSFENVVGSSFAILGGDGSAASSSLDFGPAAVSSPFSYTFSTFGDVNNGTVTASHLGSFWLNFASLGSDSYAISVTLDYQLNAAASGQAADNAVHLDYFNLDHTGSNDYTFSGLGDVLAVAGMAPTDSTTASSGVFNFTLAGGAGAWAALVGDVTISGNLEATAVPLPPAIWAFLAGCATLFRARSTRQAA